MDYLEMETFKIAYQNQEVLVTTEFPMEADAKAEAEFTDRLKAEFLKKETKKAMQDRKHDEKTGQDLIAGILKTTAP